MADTANRSRGSGRRVRGAFVPEARCGYRNPTLSSILATQMPCRTPSRSEALRSATAACGGSWRGDPPERCLSRQAGIVRYCLKYIQKSPPAKQLAGLFFGFLGFRLVAHVRYRVHGDERLGVFAVHEVHQLLVLALVHDGDDLAAFFHVVGTVGFIHRGPAVQVG